ncbi:hypothetical protein [Streptomyces sp. x-80]|uniref:hypothetical protein n=1 Tax=Streptomyces sp. x-80 TaxID=2789282 RepID=UPI00397F3812
MDFYDHHWASARDVEPSAVDDPADGSVSTHVRPRSTAEIAQSRRSAENGRISPQWPRMIRSSLKGRWRCRRSTRLNMPLGVMQAFR